MFCGCDGRKQLPSSGQPELPSALPEEEIERCPDSRVLPISYETCVTQERTSELNKGCYPLPI